MSEEWSYAEALNEPYEPYGMFADTPPVVLPEPFDTIVKLICVGLFVTAFAMGAWDWWKNPDLRRRKSKSKSNMRTRPDRRRLLIL